MINFKTIQQSSIILIVTFLCAFSISAYATEFHVTTSQELQTALSTAAENNQSDSIFLAAGTYKGNFRFETEESDTSISIQAEEGLNAGNVILDGEERDRVLFINSGENNIHVSIDRLAIKNGKSSSYPAGLYIKGNGDVDISYCNISDNYSSNSVGGCLVNTKGSTSISNTNISRNRGSYQGGLHITEGNVSLIENTFSSNINNNANNYDGSVSIYIKDQSVVIKSNRFIQNINATRSLNIYAGSTSIIVSNNIFSDNDNGNGPIRIYTANSDSHVDFNNNSVLHNNGAGFLLIDVLSSILFTSNTVLKNSSIIYLKSRHISVQNNIIVKNLNDRSSAQGSGLYVYSTNTINILSNTLSQNTTKGQGGGLYIDINNSTATLNLYNNIIWGNTAEKGGGDIYLNGYGSKKNFYNNNVHDIVGTFDFAANNIDVAPLFINTEKDDFHLGAGSLCINAGTNDAPELPALDMDGNPRIGDDIVDIGAYEHSSTDYHPADTNNDWSLSSEEVSAYETAWKNGNTWSTGPSQIPMNYLTRAGFIHQSGSAYKNAGGAKPLCWIPVE
jgi:hypothetical protein